jgi:endonuclease-3
MPRTPRSTPAARAAKPLRNQPPRAAKKAAAKGRSSAGGKARASTSGKPRSAAKPRAPTPKLRERAAQIHARFERAIPTPHVELKFESPWQLLVAVILSAQSTDRNVNRVTPELFARWPTPARLAAAPQEAVEQVILSTGFFRNKTKSIRAAGAMIAERFGGEVPRTMEEMLELPGVARKTANVVLGSAHGVPSGITVDTHAIRVSNRLGLTKHEDPVKIETDLCALFPRDRWIQTGHRFVLHGRHVCTARDPQCGRCPLNELCPARQATPGGSWEERADDEARQMAALADGFVKIATQ